MTTPIAMDNGAVDSVRTAKPLWREFAAFLAPMVLANVLQALSSTLNTIFVGQFLGTHAMAAVAAVFPLVFFLISVTVGIGAGASVLIGQAWGAGETQRVKSVAGTALALCLILGAVVALLGSTCIDALLRALQTPPALHDDAVAYARLMMLAMPAILCLVLCTQMLRGVSDTVTPLLVLVASTAVSCLLTLVFIHGWIGLPQLGVRSAAVASIVASLFALGVMAWLLLRTPHPLAPNRGLSNALRVDGPTLKLVLRIGLPAGIQSIAISAAQIALLALVNRFGPNATAAAAAVNQIVNYVQYPAMSIAITASILGAQAIGAGRDGRLAEIARTALWMNVVLTGSLIALAYACSARLIGLFITSAPVIELAQSALHIVLWSTVAFGAALVLGGVMRASGTVFVPTLIAVGSVLLIELPAAYGLAGPFGLDGVWMAYPLSFCTMLLLQAVFFGWASRRRRIRLLV